MTTLRRSRTVAVALLVALVAVAGAVGGCSDDGASGSEGTTTTATVAPSDAPFCDAFGALLAGPLADPGTDASDPAVLEPAVADSRALVDALVDTAPPQVAASAAVLSDQYRQAFDVLERYGYDLARVEAEATADERSVLDGFGRPPVGPGVDDPFGDLEDFVADHCAPGVTVPADLLTSVATSP